MVQRIVLASGSARRPELLAGLGLEFEVAPANIDETSAERDPAVLTEMLALLKARAGVTTAPDAVVIGADTLVVLDGQIIGKPADADAARATLEALRERTHKVVSGVAVVAGHRAASRVVTTHVTMRAYTDEEIAAYVASGDPLDKSGAYAVQHPTFAPAARVDGCICSVVGLPLWATRRLLREVAGIDTGAPAFGRCRFCPERESAP